MIEAYTLESLLKKYGIDATKVINKNNNILEYGEYQDIDKTLNYLVKELHINARNIEKCPSIMYKAVNNIKENYEFLITTKINTGNIETTLHILNTNPKNLKETYNYVLNNYGIEYINRITSILSTSIDRIKQIEGLFNDKSLVISAAISRNSMDEIKRIIKVCNKNNIPITSSVFKKTSEEIERIIKVCRENNIPITGSVFHKTAEEIEKIIEVCRKNNIPITSSVFHKTAEDIEKIIKVCIENNIPITGSVFLKTSEEIEKIIEVCRENNISITGSVFYKTAEEVEKIIEVCKKNNIPITGSIFLKATEEIEKSINYIKENYGQAYLTPLIINKNVEHLKNVLPYLESLGVLPYVVKSASILTLTLDEIKERKDFVESNNDTLVLQNGRFNSIFGVSRANYKKLTNNKNSITK